MSDENTPNILEQPEYKAIANRLDTVIRELHRYIEDFGNEHDMNDTGVPENSMVSGWVLTIGQVGFAEGREFHSAIVEFPDSLNTFAAIGLTDYAMRFLRSETADYSTLTDDI